MRSRSGSITPAYSTDRALLLSNYPSSRAVSSTEAKDAIARFAIYDDPTFKRRVQITTEEEWSTFLEGCRDENEPGNYNLELLLKKCYSSTFSMPPSPTAQIRSQKSADNGVSGATPSALSV